ncbi:iron complex transport system substrate-binding protein [Murinocardiopsis flavida]|uniref:Iron complex transport system substrate-binding protein n=1 Tax=Murinocardiopsis flavida TaxID=645275 RepID=A0A2P8DJE0_9ACTN|nr:iron-siderophore ABC transporter substrate-binding protein [Murinocardiopsis flavida]PSK97314.1 iron complex transport system substrate-binding protein [Murinocardiopsis flavida]
MPRTARRTHTWRALAATAAAALAVSGCGTGGTAADDGAGGGDFADIEIEHAHGTTAITEKPKRVVTVGWSDEGTLLELGVVPVGISESTFASEDGRLPWNTAKIEELGGKQPELLATDDGIPLEKIAALAPDLILGVQSGMEKKEYDDLTEIAPTVAYPDKPWLTAWQDQTRLIGKALGKEAEGEKLVEDTEAATAAIADDHPEFKDKTFAVGSVTPQDQLAFYVPGEARYELMTQLGFKPAKVIDDLDLASDTAFFGTIDLENADRVDADVMPMWYTTAQDKKRVEDNKVFAKIPAVREGGYIAFDDPAVSMAFSSPSPLSLPWAMERLEPELAKAAKGDA